jgi:hypothetical protein
LIFTVPTNAVAAWFETSAADGDVDLYVRKGLPLPDVDAYDAASVQGGTTNEVIRLRVGDPLASLTAGDWFITVRRNSAGGAVRYRLRATAPAAWDLLTGVPATNTLSAGAAQQYYRFTVSTNAIAVWFDLYGGSHDLALYGKDGLPVPDLDQNLFNLPGAGLDQARIVLTNLVIPGDWYLTVANQEVGPVTYGLRAIELIPPSIDFNSIRVTADRVQFEWTASPGLDFQVEAATNIPPVWAVVTNGVSFLNGRYLFQEDETQTTGRLPFKMYRVRITP